MRTVKFFRFRHRKTGRFALERVPVHSDGPSIRLTLASRYPPTEHDYVLEESKSCAVVHGPVEWRVHAIREVGVCQSCGSVFDRLNIDPAHEVALSVEVERAHDEARAEHCSECGSPDVLISLNGDRLVTLCPTCHRGTGRAR
ncbi:MAG: hypothetical protein ACHQM7_02625 [Vicinamibacterales bacterium]|jgi:hypothetical protein